MSADIAETLEVGMRILCPLMEAHGFKQSNQESGKGSGGAYASAEWIRGNRKLEIHFRHTLGLVRYHVGEVSLSHEEYMWAVTGERWSTQYPGFSDDPVDGFRHFAADLSRHGSSFLADPDDNFVADAKRVALFKLNTSRLP
jgi:hypothetical protein